MPGPLPENTLCYGDCLDWMERWDDASVDLIYLDPPFNSNASYNLLYARDSAGGAQKRAFTDTWSWDAAAGERLERFEGATARPAYRAIVGLAGMLGPSGMLAYLTYMAERLEHMHRLLKPTGSLYLHCDPTASYYLKVLLDVIFGPINFRNEVVWAYRTGGVSKRWFGRKHDAILFYTKQDKWTFNVQRERSYSTNSPPGFKEVRKYQDEHGRWYTMSTMRDVWEINAVGRTSGERLGYPTQKPRALLERIITASSNEGDLVLDPFCGCGTTVDAARRLKRRWCGIDISAFAIDLIKGKRLQDPSVPTLGIPADLEGARKLAREQPFAFESWAVTRLPGFAPNDRQRGDGGIDGRGTLATKPDDADSRLALAQVKGGRAWHVSHFRDFRHVMERERAALGCFVTLAPAPARSRADAKTAGRVHVSGHPYDRLHLWSMAEYFDGRRPVLPVMTDPYTGKALDQPELFA